MVAIALQNPAPRVVVVEDNARLANLIGDSLRDSGYGVETARLIFDFRRIRNQIKANLYVIDLGLPDGDGIQLIEALRAMGDRTPILVITARGGVVERVAGLDSGADDYLIKPFEYEELLARVRALLRRGQFETTSAASQPPIIVGRLMIEPETKEASLDGEIIPLRPIESRLLYVLARRAGRVVSKESISVALHDVSKDVTLNAVDKAVSRLRTALYPKRTGLIIKTAWRLGYMLDLAENAD